MYIWRTIILLSLPAALGIAQTRVELSTQSNGDFSRARATKPAKAGTTLPATCSAGEVFFKLDAAAGQNLFLCSVPANNPPWTQLTAGSGGGGGGSITVTSTAALTDLVVSISGSASNVLSIASSCTNSAPCNVRFGGNTFKINPSAPITLTVPSGANVTGMAYIYVAAGGTITAATSIVPTPTCSGCTVITSVNQFPSDSIPIATWTATAGVWDALGGTDLRAFVSNRSSINPGIGIVIADSPGQITVSADTSVVGVRVAVPSSAAGACVQGNYAADASFLYQCVTANTWLRTALATW